MGKDLTYAQVDTVGTARSGQTRQVTMGGCFFVKGFLFYGIMGKFWVLGGVFVAILFSGVTRRFQVLVQFTVVYRVIRGGNVSFFNWVLRVVNVSTSVLYRTIVGWGGNLGVTLKRGFHTICSTRAHN